jgi:hypothetical protein
MCVFFFVLFRIEEARGSRFIEPARAGLDGAFSRVSYVWNRTVVHVERDLMRQVLHYFVHTILASILNFLRACEERVILLQRSNRMFAKRVRGERTTRSMFDDVADHKAAVALTPRERKKAKEKSIGGKL